jgi:hypothetical protein
VVCRDHEGTELGKQMAREITKLEREMRALLHATGAEQRAIAVERFRKCVERGDFATVFAGKMQQLFEQQNGNAVFEDEIGALRVAMMRLMLEENDPVALANALSKVTNATIRAVKAQEELQNARPSAETLARSLEKVEAATRELSEDERQALELREWERAVGWTKEDQKAWDSPENQQRVFQKESSRRLAIMQHRPGDWRLVIDDPDWQRQNMRYDYNRRQWTIGEATQSVQEPLSAQDRIYQALDHKAAWDAAGEWEASAAPVEAGEPHPEPLEPPGQPEPLALPASSVQMLPGPPEEWDLPDLSVLEGEALTKAIQDLAWGPVGAYHEALRRARVKESRQSHDS